MVAWAGVGVCLVYFFFLDRTFCLNLHNVERFILIFFFFFKTLSKGQIIEAWTHLD